MNELLRVDPTTGEQSVLAPFFMGDVAIDAGGDIFVVGWGGAGGIYRVDPETGDLTLAFDVSLDDPWGIETGLLQGGRCLRQLRQCDPPHRSRHGAQDTYASPGLTGFGDIAEQPDGSLLAVEFEESCGRVNCSFLGSQITRIPGGDVIPGTDVSSPTRAIAVIRPACTDQLDNDGDGFTRTTRTTLAASIPSTTSKIPLARTASTTRATGESTSTRPLGAGVSPAIPTRSA